MNSEAKMLEQVNNELLDIEKMEQNKKLNIVDYFHETNDNNQYGAITKLMKPSNDPVHGSRDIIFADPKKDFFEKDKSVFTVQRNGDMIEQSYLIFEMFNNYNVENTNNLLDNLSGMDISLEIGGSRIFNIKLSLLYFICDYLGEEIIYVELDKIKNELDQFDQNVLCKKIIKKLISDHKNDLNRKFLIIPLSFNFLVKNLSLVSMQYHDVRYTTKIDKKAVGFAQSMIKNVNFGTIFIYFFHEIRSALAQSTFNVKSIVSSDPSSKKYHQSDAIIIKHEPFRRRELLKYFTVTISPQYDKIDKSLWQTVPSLLPEIQSVYDINNGEEYNLQNVDVRRGSSHILYFFSADPNYTMSKWINKHMEETDDLIELALGNKTTSSNQQNNVVNNVVQSVGMSRTEMKLQITLTPTTLPINVELLFFRHSMLRIMSGMAGLALAN